MLPGESLWKTKIPRHKTKGFKFYPPNQGIANIVHSFRCANFISNIPVQKSNVLFLEIKL